MTSRTRIARHVQRLLHGERDPRDLDQLFNWLRFHSFGLRTVKEVGDLISHAFEKDRGITCDMLSRFLTLAEFHLLPMHQPEKALPLTVERVRATALAAFESQTPAQIRHFTGKPKKSAEKVLRAGLDRIQWVQRNHIIGPLTDEQKRLVLHMLQVLVASPAFTDKQLIGELADCLVRNQLIPREQLKRVHELSDFVSAYCVEKMHLARLKSSTGTEFILTGGIVNPPIDWTIRVFASFPLLPENDRFRIGLTAFTSSCDAREWCHPVLLEAPHAWNLPIEMTSDGQLRPF